MMDFCFWPCRRHRRIVLGFAEMYTLVFYGFLVLFFSPLFFIVHRSIYFKFCQRERLGCSSYVPTRAFVTNHIPNHLTIDVQVYDVPPNDVDSYYFLLFFSSLSNPNPIRTNRIQPSIQPTLHTYNQPSIHTYSIHTYSIQYVQYLYDLLLPPTHLTNRNS